MMTSAMTLFLNKAGFQGATGQDFNISFWAEQFNLQHQPWTLGQDTPRNPSLGPERLWHSLGMVWGHSTALTGMHPGRCPSFQVWLEPGAPREGS